MKYVKIFFGFFVLFFIIGFVWGYADDVDINNPYILKHLIINADASKGPNSHTIQYQCGRGQKYVYDITGDTLQIENVDLTSFKSLTAQKLYSLPEYYPVLTAFLGLPTGGLTWQSLKAVKGSGGAMKAIVALLGVGSGLFVGKGTARYVFSSCNSNNVTEYLLNQDNWLQIERTLAAQYITQANRACANNPLKRISSESLIQEWRDFLNKAALPTYKYSSADFLLIERVEEDCQSLLPSSKNN